MDIVQVKTLSIPDGVYFIINRAADIFWYTTPHDPITTVFFYPATPKDPNNKYVQVNSPNYSSVQSVQTIILFLKWDIKQDTTNGNLNISMIHDITV